MLFPQVLEKLQSIFAGIENNQTEPLYILMGSFISKPVGRSAGGREAVQAAFDALADIIAKFPGQAENAKFLLVPGKRDAVLVSNLNIDYSFFYNGWVDTVLTMTLFFCITRTS